MKISVALPSCSLSLLGFAVLLPACGQQAAAPEAPVVWNVTWQPATTHVDRTPIVSQPMYELEMAAAGEDAQDWKVVWTGQATTARFEGRPGRYCFRAVTVEQGIRSPASPPVCATKPAGSERAPPPGSSRS